MCMRVLPVCMYVCMFTGCVPVHIKKRALAFLGLEL